MLPFLMRWKGNRLARFFFNMLLYFQILYCIFLAAFRSLLIHILFLFLIGQNTTVISAAHAFKRFESTIPFGQPIFYQIMTTFDVVSLGKRFEPFSSNSRFVFFENTLDFLR